MSEKKWTPGPWVFDGTGPHNVFGCDISNSLGDSLAGSWHGRDEVAKANAHLIAAAPELYDAGEAALDSLVFAIAEIKAQAHIPDDDMEMMLDRVSGLRAALAKARGETK